MRVMVSDDLTASIGLFSAFLHVPSPSLPQITAMKMYDFIIFEHTGLRNHMVDLCNIGQLLIDSGLKVAIANVTNERELCSDCGFKS